MSQRDKTRTVQRDVGRMGQTLARMALSMNQGNFGTCASYAFTTALCQSLLGKYGVALKMETLCQIFISKHNLWDGASPLDLANKWNALMTNVSFLDLDGQKKYKLRLKNIRRIGTLDEAHAEMLKRQDALKMIVSIKTDTKGHESHAVSADVAHASPSKDIRAINSWGAVRPTWEVTAKNFIRAVVFDPIITEVMNGTTKETVPDVTQAYMDMGMRYSMEIGKSSPHVVVKSEDVTIFEMEGLELNGKRGVAECNGTYVHIPGDRFNDKPVFTKMGKDRWMYYSTKKGWMITDDRKKFSQNRGHVKQKSTSSFHESVQKVQGWNGWNSSWTAIASAKLTVLRVHNDTGVPIKANETKSFEMRGLELSTHPEVAACNGVYAHKPGDTFNSKPVFEQVGGGRWMYLTSKKYWVITDDRSDFPKNCGFVSSASSGHPSPHDVRKWKRWDDSKWTASLTATLTTLDVHQYADAVARIKANETKSFEMKGLVSSTNTEVAACNGVYTHKPGDTFNSKPVFEKVGGGRWMYFTSDNHWGITNDRSTFPKDLGFVKSTSNSLPSPHDVRAWRGWDRSKWTAIPTATLTALTAYELAQAFLKITP